MEIDGYLVSPDPEFPRGPGSPELELKLNVALDALEYVADLQCEDGDLVAEAAAHAIYQGRNLLALIEAQRTEM
jgi:hypothetical protein